MRRILLVESSPDPASVSRRGAAILLDRLCGAHTQVLRRDLALAPPPHPDRAYAGAMRALDEARTPEDRAALALSETLIGELETSDGLVISTPMHNYTVPSSLKAWIDHVVRPRRSFGFGPQGKVGLLADRPTYVVIASGGRHGGAGEQPDFLLPYLRAVLATIGIHSVRAIALQETTRAADPLAPLGPWLAQVLPD